MIPLFKPFMPPNLDDELKQLLNSGNLSFGTYGLEFERELKKHIGNKYLLIVNSYNIAMQIVLTTIGLNSGDEILASPISCLASNQPFVTKGLRVKWVDVNPSTGLMCTIDLQRKISKNTKAIFHNHFCGYVGQIDEVNKIAFENNLIVVDDSIEAFGSSYKNNLIGNVGTDYTIFSFHSVRLPNTIDGAAITFKKYEDYKKALLIRDYGIDRSNFRDEDGEININCDINTEGFGGLMSEPNSMIGLRQMKYIDDLIQKQRFNAKAWEKVISIFDTNIKTLSINTDTCPNYWVYGIKTENKKQLLSTFKEYGLKASSVHINNNIYSIFGKQDKLNGVDEFMSKFLAIPSGWWFDLNKFKFFNKHDTKIKL
jgi:dTDP-4-amino-4,6-dideoxygalactose transaminase